MTDETDNDNKNPYGFPPDDRIVVNLRDPNDPRADEAVRIIAASKGPAWAKAFDDECE